MTDNKLKDRIGHHYTDFKHEKYKNSTTLSNYIWQLQKENIAFQIEWEFVEKSKTRGKDDKFCQLCISEKKWIARLSMEERINSNSEFVTKCPHKRKYKLARIKNTEDIDLLEFTIIPNTEHTNFETNQVIIPPRRSSRNRRENSQYTGPQWTA